MDETKILVDLVKLYADGLNAARALEQAKMAMYVSIAAVLVTFILGIINFHVAKKELKIQADKAYREIITAEKVSEYNALRNACSQFMSDAWILANEMIKCVEIKNNTNEQLKSKKIDFLELNHKLAIITCKLQLYLTHEEKDLFMNEMDDMLKVTAEIKDRITADLAYGKILSVNLLFKSILEGRWEKIQKEAQIKY